ncbi:DUF2155 domain-containing protein [Yoonia sp.]|uniref:DUF2155 domain-containing protein n=1 Tax=Yoonia sp. TaxID=2212373 RepID=UPI002FDA686E
MRQSLPAFLVLAALAGHLAAQEITTTPLIEIPVEDLDLGDGFDPDLDGLFDPDLDGLFDPDVGGAAGDDLFEEFSAAPVEAPRQEVAIGPTGVLRVLDKLTGEVTDVELASGQSRELGFLGVSVTECRYPVENPAGDAFIFVQVTDLREGLDLFAGWMIASAPALNAIDHPRYDVWALRCSTS